MAEWFLRLGDQELGPYRSTQFAEMAADGRLTPTDSIRRGDMAGWVPATKLQGLSFPPELPPPRAAPVASGTTPQIPPPLPEAIAERGPMTLASILGLLRRRPSYGVLGVLLIVSVLTVQWPFGASGARSTRSGNRFEGEVRTVLAAGRPAEGMGSTPRFNDVRDGVARGFVLVDGLVSQQLLMAALAEMKSSAEGDRMVDSMFVIIGDSDTDIRGYVERNDPADYRGRTAMAYTIAEQLYVAADRADQNLARANISAQERATVGRAYRRVCEKLAARFEASYAKLVAQGEHFLENR